MMVRSLRLSLIVGCIFALECLAAVNGEDASVATPRSLRRSHRSKNLKYDGGSGEKTSATGTATAAAVASGKERRVIIKYNAESGRAAAEVSGRHAPKKLHKINAVAGLYAEEEIAALSARDDIEYVEDDDSIRMLCDDNGPQIVPYGVEMVQTSTLSALRDANNEPIITVCIIDSGLDTSHEDLQSSFVKGKSFGKNTGPWKGSAEPHGTHVAGTIAAMGDEENCGVVGVDSGGNLRLLIARILDDDNRYAKTSTLLEAAAWCAEEGADVINMSLGGTSKSKAEKEVFQDLYDEGRLLIAAAGNDGHDHNKKWYPAALDPVIAVASVGRDEVVAYNSNHGKQVEIAAPGVGVLSTTNTEEGALGSVTVDGVRHHAIPMMHAAPIDENDDSSRLTGVLVDCGYGIEECPVAADSQKPHLCLIKRGSPDTSPDAPLVLYADKVKACEATGGAGAIIYNNRAGEGPANGHLDEKEGSSIPAVGISLRDGEHLMEHSIGDEATVHVDYDANYEFMWGTSMAAPHVTGVAAILWSHHRECTNEQIRRVMQVTAKDKGKDGRDEYYGFGIVQAQDALDYLNEHGCDSIK